MGLKLLCLPLDDRPCNYEAIRDLAGIAKIDVRLPPRQIVSHFDDFSFEKMYEWLDFQMGWNDAAVISAEMFFYGGLVRSRKGGVSENEVVSRADALKWLLAKHKHCKVYFSSVLLRLSITVNSAQSEENWKDIFQYSVLSDKVTFSCDPAEQAELKRLESKIPEELLQEYLAVRSRNHSVNRLILELSEKAEFVIFGQEDCAEFGLHRSEKMSLMAALKQKTNLEQERVVVLTGADELNSLLVLQAYMDHIGQKNGVVPVSLKGAEPSDLEKISKFEDIPVIENIKLHLRASPFVLSGESSEQRIVVLPFGEAGQQDLFFLQNEELRKLTSKGQSIARALKAGDALLDLTFGNGVHFEFFKEVLAHVNAMELSAFSSWNTTGNRLGTLIAHLGLSYCAKLASSFSEEAHKFYLFTHLVDDGVYQGKVRAELLKLCKEEGENPWALSSQAWERFSERCNTMLQEEVSSLGLGRFAFKASLPWNRIFEVRVEEVKIV